MKLILTLTFLCLSTYAYGFPSLSTAEICTDDKCKIENNCRCSSTTNPISTPDDPSPQFIVLTVSESIVTTLYENYLKPLLFDRKNPDGSPVGASFYINHEFTDYTLVQDLYLRGFEIGSHSITKNSSQQYWRDASLDDLVQEFGGQKQILSTFANLPAEDIIGGRTPQLRIKGDLTIEAYTQSELIYDNSWPTKTNQPLFPYTLDYLSTQECVVSDQCPQDAHAGFWISPITNIHGQNDTECNSFPTCLVNGSPDEIANWFIAEVDRVEKYNREPLVLRLDSYWFDYTKNSFQGFTKFLDQMLQRPDVFLISAGDLLEWIKAPVSAANYHPPDHSDRYAECLPATCTWTLDEGKEAIMKSCIPCPNNYPWKGNPLGD